MIYPSMIKLDYNFGFLTKLILFKDIISRNNDTLMYSSNVNT